MTQTALPASFLSVVDKMQAHPMYKDPAMWGLLWLDAPVCPEWLTINDASNFKSYAAWLYAILSDEGELDETLVARKYRSPYCDQGFSERLTHDEVEAFLGICRELVPEATGQAHLNIQAALKMREIFAEANAAPDEVYKSPILMLVVTFKREDTWEPMGTWMLETAKSRANLI